MPLPFFDNSDKLVGAQVLPLKSFNILAVAFTDPKTLLRVYTNEKVQDIICAIIEARFISTKSLYEYSLKVWLLNIYKDNNHIACYNFC